MQVNDNKLSSSSFSTIWSFYPGFSELIISGVPLQIFLFDWTYKMSQWVNVCSDTLNPNAVPLD